MSLMEQIKLEEEQLTKAMESDDETVEDQDTADEGDDEEEADETPGEQDEGSDDSDAEDESEEENDDTPGKQDEGADNSLAAQLRIAKKREKELEARLDAMEKRGTQQPTQTQQPQQQQVPKEAKAPTMEERMEAFEKYQREQDAKTQQRELLSAAVQEFTEYENQYTEENPDYANASTYLVTKMTEATRMAYPNATDQQVAQHIQQQVLGMAANAVQRGYNPAESLYQVALERFGYQPNSGAKPRGGAEADPAKKLATVNKNMKRSKSPLQKGGHNGSPSATIEEAANMSIADFSKLSDSELQTMIDESM